MKVKIAYIEEPPFGWTTADHEATGADIELAETILRAIGVTRVEHQLTTFAELLPGVKDGRWDMNVPLFVTPQRMTKVDFSMPVWAISDGFLVRQGNSMALDNYDSVAQCNDARLGIIAGQVQHQAAQLAGVRDDQMVLFDQQADAIEALLTGKIDAYASTALGNRILADRIGHELVDAVSHRCSKLSTGSRGRRDRHSERRFNRFDREARLRANSVSAARRRIQGSSQ